MQDNRLGIAPEQLPKLIGVFKRLHIHVGGTAIGFYTIFLYNLMNESWKTTKEAFGRSLH